MAVTTVKKALAGVEDLLIDAAGTGVIAQVPTSRDGTRPSTGINASKIPLTTTARANVTASNAAMSAIDVDAAIIELGDELAQIGIPDGAILTFNAGTLEIATASITNAKMAVNSIDSDEYVDGSIDNEHLAPTSGTAAVAGTAATGALVNVVQAKSIDTADIADSAIETLQLNALSVTAPKINVGQTKRVFSHSVDMQIEVGQAPDLSITTRDFFVAPVEGATLTHAAIVINGQTVNTGTLACTINLLDSTELATVSFTTTNPSDSTYSAMTLTSADIPTGHNILNFTLTQAGGRDIDIFTLHLEYTIKDA